MSGARPTDPGGRRPWLARVVDREVVPAVAGAFAAGVAVGVAAFWLGSSRGLDSIALAQLIELGAIFFALVLLGGRYLMHRNLMQKFMGTHLVLPGHVWDKLNLVWASFFVAMGLVNLYVAFSGHFTESQWVNFKAFGLLGLMLVFVVAQSLWLGRYLQDSSDNSTPPKS